MTVGSVQQSWKRIEAWLAEHAPETHATLNPPATEAAIASVEEQLGVPLPADLRAALLIHDGTASGPGAFMVYGRYALCSTSGITNCWRMLTELLLEQFNDEGMIGSWWHPQWIPFAEDNAACQLIVDGRPGEGYGSAAMRDKVEGASFGGHSSWPSFAVLLAETADLLVGNRFDHTTVPKVMSRRLTWAWIDEIADHPRSLLALGAAAAPLPDPEPAPQTPPHRPDGRYATATVRTRARTMRAAEYGRPPNHSSPAWIIDSGRCCLTFLRGNEDTLITAFGGDPDDTSWRTREQATLDQASWRNGYLPTIRVGSAGEWAFGFETGQESGTSPEIMRRLSVGTEAVSLAVNATHAQLVLARHGAVVGRFDSRRPDTVVGSEPDGFRTLLAEAGLHPTGSQRNAQDETLAALALAIRIGPGEFDQQALGAALRTAALLPLLPDPTDQPRRLSVEFDPDLVTAIESAAEPRLRAALGSAIRRLVDTTELADHPEVLEALTEAEQQETGVVDSFSPLGQLLRTQHAEAHAATVSRIDRADRAARDLLTEPERRAWRYRSQLATIISEFLARPAIVSAYSLPFAPEQFSQRDHLLLGLGTQSS